MKWEKKDNCNSLKDFFLKNMGVESLDDVNNWFRLSYSNRYNICKLYDAVKLAKRFLHRPVHIVGDYDTDGVTATSILYQGLKEYGFSDVNYRIPLRFSEGFGINEKIIDEINEGLIITCDNGIAGIDVVKKAKEKGLTVIITDHHAPQVKEGKPILPDADIIIDPNAVPDSADFNGYCGAGLAYKFICALFENDTTHTRKYLPLAAIGTVGDVMQLHEENYVFVRNGLKLLGNPAFCTAGLLSLLHQSGLQKNITSEDISFKIAPAINAASRMYDNGASYAVQLLCCTDPSDAQRKAAWFIKNNEKRKSFEKVAMEKARQTIKKNNLEKKCPIVIHIPNVSEGIIGIVAGHLCERYMVPVLVFTDAVDQDGTAYFKGSARSCGDYNIKEAFDRNAEFFIKFGGHSGAAGMSIKPEALHGLSDALQEDAKDYHFPDPDLLPYDLDITTDKINDLTLELPKYAPYGEGNPQPVFHLQNFLPVMQFGEYRKVLGKDGNSIKLHGNNIDALGFHMAEKFESIPEKSALDIVGSLSVNKYKGNCTNQIQIMDFHIHNEL